ncbi:MAG: right-handed parallel beta-helix repeat-containing protein [Bacteroidota bacterium]
MPNVLMRVVLRVEDYSEVEEDREHFSFAYKNPEPATANSFYNPFWSTRSGNQDAHIRYYGMSGESKVLASVDPVAGSFIEDFIGETYVMPYNLDYVCAQSGASCSPVYTAHSVFLSPVPYTPPEFGEPTDGSLPPVYTFAPGADVIVPDTYTWDWDVTDLELKFPEKLTVDGDLSADGLIFDEAYEDLGWGGVEVRSGGSFTATNTTMIKNAALGLLVEAGATADLTDSDVWHSDEGIRTSGALTLTGGTVEGATGGAAVAVFDPGTATISGTTLRHSQVGLEVRAAGGTVLSGATVRDNGTGILADAPQTTSDGVLCEGTCPTSDLSVFDSDVYENGGSGIEAFFAELEMQGTKVRDNDSFGLFAVSSAVGEDLGFQNNLVVRNGGIGIAGQTGTDLFLSPSNAPGENRIASNDGSEIAYRTGSSAFLGNSVETGQNSVFDPDFDASSSFRLVKNLTQATLFAQRVYWGEPGAPPAGAFTGPVNAANALLCDPVFPPAPDDPNPCAQSRPAGPVATAGRSDGLSESFALDLQATRAALAAAPEAPEADSLAWRLGALHRLDREDALGEWAETAVLLGALQVTLAGADLSEEAQAAAEAALAVDAVRALGRGEVGAAAELLRAWGPYVVSDEVGHLLETTEAVLLARAGAYAEAAERASALAERETDAEERASVGRLAAHFAARAAEGDGAREMSPALRALLGEEADGLGASAQVSGSAASLVVYPNPAARAATVALVLPEAGEATVAVFDVLGRRVARLHAGPLSGGTHRFELSAAGLPSGVYLVRAEGGPAGDAQALTERITLVK